MKEHELWDERVVCVRENEVTSHSGHPLRLRTLVQLCWGWPRKASEMVVTWLRKDESRTGHEAVVWIAPEARVEQQRRAFREIPGLADVLCDGLAGRVTRESRTFNTHITGLAVSFDWAISDEGMTTAVMRAVSSRLGCTLDELRRRTTFTTDSDGRGKELYINTAGLDP